MFSGLALFAIALKRSGALAAQSEQTASNNGSPTPVLVELFTSEGCSSCPPADALLAKLARTQLVPGAQVIALEEHVDYWDHQGWRDPFSSANATARQTAYADSFGNEGPYTPQMVVDGTSEFVGSNERVAGRAIERAAKAPKTAIELRWPPDKVQSGDARPVLEVRVSKLSDSAANDSAEVFLAVTEDNLHSNVAGGENSGRALDHANVVRRLDRLGKADPSKDTAFAAHPVLNLNPAWKHANLRAVVFVQENKSRRVLAAAALPLP